MSRMRGSFLVGLAAVSMTVPAPARAMVVPEATPRAVCGPGSRVESGIQGRVTAEDMRAGLGSSCNMELLGHTGTLGGFRTHRFVDSQGNECAFFDTTPLLPTRPTSAYLDPSIAGTFVVDMSDPSRPVQTATLDTAAMRSPHESLSLHAGRGLLASNLGNLTTAPGVVDIYDVKTDCRRPALLSSLPVGGAGHEGSFSPDGNTLWVANPAGFFAGADVGGITAVDVSNPLLPRTLWTSAAYTSHGLNTSPDGNTLYFADMSPAHGLTVLDVSQVQARAAVPVVRKVAHLTWDTVSIPQAPIPVTIGGHPYVVEVDEFTSNTLQAFTTGGSFSDPAAGVGAARIIDVADPSRPTVVSDLRLDVHSPEARAGDQKNDPGAESALGYAGHYCAVPRTEDPGIVACSFILSGLRVFDIRDPARPVEIAYFNPPTTTPETPYAAMSAPAFAPERSEIWYTDGNYGFYALRVTNDVW